MHQLAAEESPGKKRRIGSRSLAGNRVARGTGGGGEGRLCGRESLNQDEWFSRPGKRPIPQTQRGVNTADANPAVATRRSRLSCCNGTTANQKTKHPNCGLDHPTAGSRFFFYFFFFFLLLFFSVYFEIPADSRTNQPSWKEAGSKRRRNDQAESDLKSAQLRCSEAVTWSRESQRPEQTVALHGNSQYSPIDHSIFSVILSSVLFLLWFQIVFNAEQVSRDSCGCSVCRYSGSCWFWARKINFGLKACKKWQTSPTCIKLNAVVREELKRLKTFSLVLLLSQTFR